MADAHKKIRSPGRPKGVANKRSWNMRLELEAAGFEPLPELLRILANTEDDDKRWDRIAWLVQFIYPRLKEVETLPPAVEPEENPASSRSTEALMALELDEAEK